MHDFKGPVCTTTEEFENGGFTLKTHHMFSIHKTPEGFEYALQSPVISVEFVFEENSVDREMT